MMRITLFLVAGLALSGCTSTMKEAKISESFQLNYDNVVPVKETSPDGAIYSRAQSGFFLGDRRAQRVGDVLTIRLNETTAASKSNDAAVNRNGTASLLFETVALICLHLTRSNSRAVVQQIKATASPVS